MQSDISDIIPLRKEKILLLEMPTKAWHISQKDGKQEEPLIMLFVLKIPRVKSLPCLQCSQPAAHYHHHKGYDSGHQLDVIPMCWSCHRLVHPKLN